MILRRFMKHTTDQNWFAVGLDIIVVITGIFLGMQATEWNEERKTRLKEAVYVGQFQADLETSITLGEEFRIKNEAFAKATKVLARMAAGSPSGIDTTVFHNQMASGTYRLGIFRFVRKTWQELISSGRYYQFGDAALRQLIDRIVERQDLMIVRAENLFSYTRDMADPWLTKHYDMWRIHTALRSDAKDGADIPKAIGIVDVAAILTDRTFRNMLAYRCLFLSEDLKDYQVILADYKLLQQALATRLSTLEG